MVCTALEDYSKQARLTHQQVLCTYCSSALSTTKHDTKHESEWVGWGAGRPADVLVEKVEEVLLSERAGLRLLGPGQVRERELDTADELLQGQHLHTHTHTHTDFNIICWLQLIWCSSW